MTERIKPPEKIQISYEKIAKLSGAQFKTLEVRMLREMIECGCKIEEEVKAMKSEIKKNIQGSKSEGKETRAQINNLDLKEEIKTQPGKEIRMKK